MKILCICQHYYPENFQITDICEQLVIEGHEVTVLVGLPNYPTGKIPDEYKHGKKRNEKINGVHVIRCFEIGRKKSAVGLAINYLSYSISASIKVLTEKFDFDIIYSYQLSPILMVIPAVLLKKKYKKPLFLYCCDLWPESMKIMLKNDQSIIYKAVSKLSTYLYRKCDKIAVQSKYFICYFTDFHAIDKDKICYIPQFGDSSYLDMDLNEEHEITNFMFMGNIGIAQDMDCILKAVFLIKEKKYMLHIVGDGTYLTQCKRLVNEYKIQNKVKFYGRCPVSEMPKFYKIADACLLTLKDGLLIGNTIPSKLQGYMAAGKPVIGAINGAAQEVIRKSGCGRCTCAGNAERLSEIMSDFIDNREKYLSCGENGRSYFKSHFTKELYIKNTLKQILDLVGEK